MKITKLTLLPHQEKPLNIPRAIPTPAILGALFCLFCCVATQARAADLPQTIAAVKPSVVGIGTFLKTRSPAIRFTGTGFVVGDGLNVITNAHVVAADLDSEKLEVLGIVIAAGGDRIEFRPATLAGTDREHDLAHLVISGKPLPALQLSDGPLLAEGSELAFTGYPLGMVLGLHPVSHRALLAAVTPIVMPSLNSGKLTPNVIAQLQRSSFQIYQLDGTAFPGNSGSPVYDPQTGVVQGIINMVFVKGLKETAITNPSGITYAVPVSYARELMQRNKASQK